MLSYLPETSLEKLQVRRKMDLIAKVFKSQGHWTQRGDAPVSLKRSSEMVIIFT